MSRACGIHGGRRRNAYKFSIKNHEGRSTLGRPRHRWGIILKWFIKK